LSADLAARARLEADQGALLKSLWSQGEIPPGFDAERVALAGSGLASKRRRALGSSWSTLREAVGTDFDELYQRYAKERPLPRYGGPLADGRLFLRWLDSGGRRRLPNQVRLQELGLDLRFELSDEGFKPRGRKFAACWTVFRGPPRIVLGLRFPPFGDRWLAFPPWPWV